ncbi:hypothetical protein [Schinkia azotoformans]|uniref:hypothetical protein n=1 Tax=Schinkia azotoformans TaxID=1454 RepID=UPI002DB7B116|nr:hypothetical protein [Schinkia azotoformans]MEC1714736.1 hypothetical protein [Schinkia azotoformans]MEC1757508.1 hypothetical protein [Schinkia azotoformans]
MSSTNRSGVSYMERKSISDYYRTPIEKIDEFLKELLIIEPEVLKGEILDPCAGGDSVFPMSYPQALINIGVKQSSIRTVDIRDDSLAEIKADYLSYEIKEKPKVIITNPPFLIAQEIIEKALQDCAENGFVIMLLRLNFFGGKKRKELWERSMPKYCFVHHRRMSFTDDGKTDSVEYAHFVWQKGFNPVFAEIKII